jgi:hypothetical protein
MTQELYRFADDTGALRSMRAGLYPVLGLLLLIAGCAGNQQGQSTPQSEGRSATVPAAGVMSDADVSREANRLRRALLVEVPEHTIGNADGAAAWIARTKAVADTAQTVIDRAQLLVVVDRDPAVQELRIILARPDAPWQVIGGSKVSTGQAGTAISSPRPAYSCTPTVSSTIAPSAHSTKTISGGSGSGECACGILAGRQPNVAGCRSRHG